MKFFSKIWLAFVLVIPQISQAALFGVTSSSIVIIDPINTNNVSVVGHHLLPSDIQLLNTLSYDPSSQKLFGIGYNMSLETSYLLEFDRKTGHGAIAANLGGFSSGGGFEAIEYVDSLNSLVVSANLPNHGLSQQLLKISGSGLTSPILVTGLDNDSAVYDSINDLFYTVDPNGAGQLVNVNLNSGVVSNLGSIPLIQDMAFWQFDASIYSISVYTNQLYRIQTQNGLAPISVDLVGTVSGDEIRGLAFAPHAVPEPNILLLLTTGLLTLARICRSQ